MSKNNLFILILLCVLSLSCQKEDPYGLNQLSGNVLVATGSATDIGSFDAKLLGAINIDALASYSFKVGFLYGETQDLLVASGDVVRVTAKNIENNYYSIQLESLLGNKVYYYRAVLELNGNYYYGEIQEFYTTSNPELGDYLGKWECEPNITLNSTSVSTFDWSGMDKVEITEEYIELPVSKFASDIINKMGLNMKTIKSPTYLKGKLYGTAYPYEFCIYLTASRRLKITQMRSYDSKETFSYTCHRY